MNGTFIENAAFTMGVCATFFGCMCVCVCVCVSVCVLICLFALLFSRGSVHSMFIRDVIKNEYQLIRGVSPLD